MKLFSKNASEEPAAFDAAGQIPAHVAIIMDGNGRWAKKRLMPRIAGHRQGMETLKKITLHAAKLGVKVLTVYAFSTENWKRPQKEVDFLMQMPVDLFGTFVPDLIKNNVKVRIMGFTDQLPAHTQKACEEAIKDTAHCTGMTLNFAMNYGSRAEIARAVKEIAQDAADGKLAPEEISEETIQTHLMTADLGKLADPEFLIRTSGEERLSNFLLWQLAYSEMYFTDTYWPDFDEKELEKALGIFQHRNRRFGGIEKEDA